jgi:L-fuconolactonase
MVVVDTHCHASPHWYEPVEILLDQMNRNGVDKAVIVQIRGWYDNSYPVECMQRFPGRFSVVAVVDTDSAEALERLEGWVEQGVEGVRLGPEVRSPGDDPLAIWRKAAELGIVVSSIGPVDGFASPGFESIVKELPSLKIIIEHLGGVGGIHGREDTIPPHNTYLMVLALARYPNVYMKVPGLGEISPRAMPVRAPYPFEDAPPFIEMAIDAFGANRLMWGSDFPPVATREGYRNALRLPMERVRFKSREDKDWVFGNTAASLFRFGR